MLRENYAIKFCEEEKTKLQASKVRKFLAIKKLKKQIDVYEDGLKHIRSAIFKTENKIKIWKEEKSWKRSCYALLKKHDYLWFDDTDYESISNIHKNSSWNTIVTEGDLMSHSCSQSSICDPTRRASSPKYSIVTPSNPYFIVLSPHQVPHQLFYLCEFLHIL